MKHPLIAELEAVLGVAFDHPNRPERLRVQLQHSREHNAAFLADLKKALGASPTGYVLRVSYGNLKGLTLATNGRLSGTLFAHVFETMTDAEIARDGRQKPELWDAVSHVRLIRDEIQRTTARLQDTEDALAQLEETS